MGELEEAWSAVRAFMQRTCGVVLAPDQSYLLEARLGPVAKAHGHASTYACVKAACALNPSSPLAQAVVDAMTTHESFFFRDAGFWDTFEKRVLPSVTQPARTEPLRIWSAACSHGQETYSFAMLLEERWPELAASTTILGTDVSALALDKAREGVYSSLEVNRGLGAARLVRHFVQERTGFRVKPALRERVRWQVHSLLDAVPEQSQPSWDIVACRNVLIYFDEQDRAAVLRRLLAATKLGGYLGVGSTEIIPGSQLASGWFHRTASATMALGTESTRER